MVVVVWGKTDYIWEVWEIKAQQATLPLGE